jgi:hypothetical protein
LWRARKLGFALSPHLRSWLRANQLAGGKDKYNPLPIGEKLVLREAKEERVRGKIGDRK